MPLKRITRTNEQVVIEEKGNETTAPTKTQTLLGPKEIVCKQCGNPQLIRSIPTVVECMKCGSHEFSVSEEFNIMCEICRKVISVKDSVYGQCQCRKSKEWRTV